MDIDVTLEVAIGLVAMYLLLALFCTIVTEMFATVLSWRAKSLKEGITKLLADPNFASLSQDFFNIPVIRSLAAVSGKEGPSYIPSRTFAAGILDYVTTGKLPAGQPLSAATDLHPIIDQLPDSDLKKTLKTLLDDVGGKADEFRQRVAQWYDDAMERWSGIYKRKAQTWSVGIAVVIALLFNADTFSVARTLWTDPLTRARAVAAAQNLTPAQLTDPAYEKVSGQLREFPLGWRENEFKTVVCDPGVPLLLKLFGILLSALAIALGAPFWFEVLNKLNAIRGAGRKPAVAAPTQ